MDFSEHSFSFIELSKSNTLNPKSDLSLPFDIPDPSMEMMINAFAAAEYCYCLKICHVRLATYIKLIQ